MTRTFVATPRIWVLATLVTATVVIGFAAFSSQNVPVPEALYETAALFFAPYDTPDGVTLTPALAVARATGLATSLTAVLAIYIAVTGTSLRTLGRRLWGHLRGRHGHIIVLTDQAAAIGAPAQHHLIRISATPQPGSQAVVSMDKLPRAAIRERAMHAHAILIATQSFTSSLAIATSLRDYARNHRHSQVLLLIQAKTAHDITLLRESAMHDHYPLPVDAYLPEDVYAAALVRRLRTSRPAPTHLAIAASPIAQQSISTVLASHRITTEPIDPTSAAAVCGLPLAVTWQTDADTDTVLTLSTSSHEPKWCITAPRYRRLAEELGYTVVIADPSDMDLTLEASTINALARRIHEQYIANNPQTELGPWDTLNDSLKAANYAQAARIRTLLRAHGYSLTPNLRTIKLPEPTLEELARSEHQHWVDGKYRDNWTFGPRDDRAKTHPLLVSWDELPESEKKKNREIVRTWPALLASAVNRRD